MSPRILFTFLLVILKLSFIFGNKYAKESNLPSTDDDFPTPSSSKSKFRIQKLNFVWSKAIRKLTDGEQKEFFVHLRQLDKQYLAAKYERDDGTDGTLEKDVERSLENLLNRYGLDAVYESLAASEFGDKTFGGGGGDEKSRNVGDSTAKSKSATFKDQKLRRLWLDAVGAGSFDDDELRTLEEEFLHHQKKLDEYGSVSKRLSDEGKENSVLDDDDDDAKVNHGELKQKFKTIQRDYDSLKSRVAEKVQSNKMKESSTITHPRVVPLLEKARTMYSGDELDSIEEELRHFEARLKKLEYLETEAAQGKLSEPDPSAKATKKEKSAKIYDREVADQFSDLSRKVEKYEKYLSSKLEL